MPFLLEMPAVSNSISMGNDKAIEILAYFLNMKLNFCLLREFHIALTKTVFS